MFKDNDNAYIQLRERELKFQIKGVKIQVAGKLIVRDTKIKWISSIRNVNIGRVLNQIFDTSK
jgi:hypothetical protein